MRLTGVFVLMIAGVAGMSFFLIAVASARSSTNKADQERRPQEAMLGEISSGDA